MNPNRPASALPKNARGIILVLTAGLLTLLGFMAVVFGHGLRLTSDAGARRAERMRSGLLSESGLSYAQARLYQSAAVPGAAHRGDDWTSRGDDALLTLPVGGLSNPSYARGEPWPDDGDGVHAPGEERSGPGWIDLDGDGCFSAWSGRLRVGRSPFDSRFSLRVRSDAGLVPINAGELGNPDADHDYDGVPNRLDPEHQGWLAVNPAPWADPDAGMNVSLVNLLDSLGGLLAVSDAAPEPYTPAYGNWPPTQRHGQIVLSRLGRRIVSGRPRGGYASVEDLLHVLGAADYAKAAPFLTAAGDRTPRDGAVVAGHAETVTRSMLVRADQPLIDLNAAPEAVLRAALRIAAAGGLYHDDPLYYNWAEDAEFQAITTESSYARILESEAAGIAGLIAQERRSAPIRSWKRLLELLATFPAVEDEPFTAIDERTGPARETRRRLLEDLVLSAFNAETFVPDPFSRSRDTLEVEREGILTGEDLLRARQVPSAALLAQQTAPYNASGLIPPPGTAAQLHMPVDYLNPPPPEPGHPTPAYLKTRPAALFALAGGPRRYDIESEGRSGPDRQQARRSARAACGLPFAAWRATGQEDFEMRRPVPGSPRLFEGGDVLCDGSVPPERNGIQSHPRSPISSYTPEALLADFPNMTADQKERLGEAHAYPPLWGDLRLAARQAPVSELLETTPPCVFALPFNEDSVPGPDNLYSPDDWKDNFGDPTRRPEGSPIVRCYSGEGRGMAIGGWARFGPCGLRLFPLAMVGEETGEPEDGDFLSFRWDDGSAPCPLTRGDYHDPGGSTNVVSGGGEIRNATITFSFPARGGETPVAQYGDTEFTVQFESQPVGGASGAGVDGDEGGKGGMGGGGSGGEEEEEEEEEIDQEDIYFSYLKIRVLPGDILMLSMQDGSSAPAMPPPVPFASGRRWRHAAVTIDGGTDPDDGIAHASAWIDGVLATTAPFTLDTGRFPADKKPTSGALRLKIVQGPLDDLKFFNATMSAQQIQDEATRAFLRHETSGSYLSGLLTFDRGRFPRGAALTGASWSAFAPAACRASAVPMTFTVYAYGDDPTAPPLGEARFHWSGDPAALQEADFRLPPCRHFRWQVVMRSTTPADTPVLDEFRVHYERPGASWTAYATD